MTETKTPPPPNVWPTLRANDAPGLIKFLSEALGFEATAVYADGDKVHHAELAWPPGGGVMLGSARPDDPNRVTGPAASARTSSRMTRTRCAPAPWPTGRR